MLPGKTYSVDDVLRIARRRIWLVLVPFGLIAAGTAVVARKLPDSYRADTLILVVPQRIPESYVRATITMRIEDRIQAIRQQILSRTVLEETIKKFNLYPEQRKAGTIMEDMVGKMRSDIKIEPIKQGDAFLISYVGRDPSTVMRVTEYLTNSFINQNLKDRTSLAEGTNQFLETQLEDARRRLLEQEQKLQAYNQAHSGELPAQQPSNLQAISNLQSQIRSVLNQISSDQDKRRSLEREISDIQTEMRLFPPVDPIPPPGGQANLGTASQRLNAARAQLATYMAQKFTDEHPQVKAIKREIARLQKEVDDEALKQPVKPTDQRAVSPGQYAQQKKLESLNDELEMINRRIESNQAEEKKLRALSDSYQYKADMAPARASELVELTRDYATLQGLYSSLLAKKEESKMAANLESRQIGEQFRLVDPAKFPERPFKPNRMVINMVGMTAGLAVGVALVGLLEWRDSSFKTDDEVSNVLTLPVLAVVPLMQSNQDRERLARRNLIASVGLGSTVLGCLAVVVYTFVR
jgi:polysaccharide chain length determinant protein (PEP-CTERM system associated)